MTEIAGGTAAILAVCVGPADRPVRLDAANAGVPDAYLKEIRDLLAKRGGREVPLTGGDRCFAFTGANEALAAAIDLTSSVGGPTTPIAGTQFGVGLDLSDAPDDPVVAERVAGIARSAQPNEIRLGEALAAVALHDPPDRRMVRRVPDDPGPSAGTVYRLANAKDEIPNNLVPALTSFVGRQSEIAEVRRLIGRARLVTVTGPPGAGKTRLAGEIAERLLGRFDDGVWFVALAPISDPKLVVPTIADGLGLRPATDRSPVDVVTAHLRNHQLMVVLDNFEHVTDAATEIAVLLASVPGLQVLVTSRTLLHISGEHEYALPPLELPSLDLRGSELGRSEAVDLFAVRAAASQPTFRLSDENVVEVGQLCRRLDGLPLAIELAAARAKLLSLPAILARLDHRLSLLTGGPRDLPARHQSLRAAIAWSYDLLEPSAQRLLRQLSVFRGGWTIDGAAAISGPDASEQQVFDVLGALLDSSLLVRMTPDAAVPRFTMLETLREFAAERRDAAGEADAVRARHAAYCLELVERYEPEFTGPDQAAVLDRVGMEHDNLRTALDYLLGAKPEDALTLAAAMWRFWQMRGHLVEGGGWLTKALMAGAEEASAEVQAKALSAAGGLAYWRGDMAEARRLYEQTLFIRRRIGDPLGIAGALYDLAFVFQPRFYPLPDDPGRTAEGLRLTQEADELYRNAGDEAGIARSQWLFAVLMWNQDLGRSRDLLAICVERFRRLNDPFGLGWALYAYGGALLDSGESAAAAQALQEALRLFSAARDGSATGLLLAELAKVASAEGDALRAARLNGAAASTRQETEADLAFDHDPWRVDATTRGGLIDAAAVERAWADGQAMSQAEAIAYALASDAEAGPDAALRVTALGSFHVERSGLPVSHWGGAKAGSRQAQAMFAFLLDRGERGVTKDEFIEVIWPDAELEQGDLNFHRTLGGLRTTLEPARASGSGEAVLFANGRYRLSPSVIGWSDVSEFEQRLLNASQATDDAAANRGLEAARSLYRGDYLDDCPLYGDSEYVEERRRFLRGRMTDALVDLGRRYETRGEGTLAAERFRQALTISGGDCPLATAGLQRLGAAIG